MVKVSEFEFDDIVDRSDSSSMKWCFPASFLTPHQVRAEPIPMWLADMDFRSPSVVVEAIQGMVAKGVFGYSSVPASYFKAVADWQSRRFGWPVDEEWIVPVASVIAALKTLIHAFSRPGDSVLIQPPVYVHFHHDVLINGRQLAMAPLRFDGERYRFDPEAFERAIQADTKLFILCNPHNPTGNVWSPDELRAMGDICRRHGVLVISDEIHGDFVFGGGKRHTPFASLGDDYADNSVTCISASKTFNLAGLQCANIVVSDKGKRDEIKRTIERNMNAHVNMVGALATEAAYTSGDQWVDALVGKVAANHEYFRTEVNSRVDGIRVLDSDSLYLAWIDCRDLQLPPADLENFLLTKARVWFDRGPKFGKEGHGFMRANLACPRQTLDRAISQLTLALPRK
ncbi:MalY/PatB family protein [Cupriavidus taiwanensis]|uniref:cysteine-S-conjugate beta-lyase n=1 Tax=Cupriavidus taiwanensis TaxID=164546 RepID=A0A7Z7NPC0_9BURK|nr:MalY/PatB family protein [Cupriavidus taiwanensis]SOZ09595.1 Cystathionine beta-lyase PatB [Cupriavidus taiwanensis]SOZ11717.1 Cystathionine beta-lyase PatB [Cupriavidus taiwanensis]SOZ43072.1 Cystathionine beta-lyase PatB [Cupriavidus taiwanensis]SPC22318.1 Cystathionine beta-lyase PatB [Cupriavidus taiwanensis]SPD53822.1 Aspartate aminotransferase [Cupriavidus taiwanensis]